jgi:hypothetical protein
MAIRKMAASLVKEEERAMRMTQGHQKETVGYVKQRKDA